MHRLSHNHEEHKKKKRWEGKPKPISAVISPCNGDEVVVVDFL